MKKMKKVLSMILCALIVMTAVPTVKVNADVENNAEYEYLEPEVYAEYVEWYSGAVDTALFYFGLSLDENAELSETYKKDGITAKNYKALIKKAGKAVYIMDDVNATFEQAIVNEYFNSGEIIDYNNEIIDLADKYTKTADMLQDAIIDKDTKLVNQYLYDIGVLSEQIKNDIDYFESIKETLGITLDADYSEIEQ